MKTKSPLVIVYILLCFISFGFYFNSISNCKFTRKSKFNFEFKSQFNIQFNSTFSIRCSILSIQYSVRFNSISNIHSMSRQLEFNSISNFQSTQLNSAPFNSIQTNTAFNLIFNTTQHTIRVKSHSS